MRFKITFAPTADQSFARLPKWARERFNAGFDLLERELRGGSGPVDVHQLHGYKNVWTWRVPPYRSVYAVAGSEIVMLIFGHRATVYQDLHHLIPPRKQEVSATSLSRRDRRIGNCT
jgi:mRNA-degrading endonuclease RelE of RelBE toxin-antitoxin system